MSYTVKSTERTRKQGSDGETKALLYLITSAEEKEDIFYLIIDFFNDLTGMDRYAQKLWDVQSKSGKQTPPKELGTQLVTLFKNYLSDIEFSYYILFLGGVSKTISKNIKDGAFKFETLPEDIKQKIIAGLKEESIKKEYIDNKEITDKNINRFLKHVLFVIDTKPPEEYLEQIIGNYPKLAPHKEELTSIFEELKEKQSAKKDKNNVEDLTIKKTEDALNYCRHFTKDEIKLFILERLINKNPFEKGIPAPFLIIYNQYPTEKDKQDLLDSCKQDMCRALFNKNAAKEFWKLFGTIYNLILQFPHDDINQIYDKIDSPVRDAQPDFNIQSLKYFIAVIKEGIEDEDN